LDGLEQPYSAPAGAPVRRCPFPRIEPVSGAGREKFGIFGKLRPETAAGIARRRGRLWRIRGLSRAGPTAGLLIERAKALAEPPEGPLLLFSVLYGFWVANYIAFKGDVMRELAAEFLTLAETQRATFPRVLAHRIVGTSLLLTDDIAEGRAHLDRAMVLYDPVEHRRLATRFGQDVGAATLSYRSFASWSLGYPAAALADAGRVLESARDIGQAATLMYALWHVSLAYIHAGNYAAANELAGELIALAEEKGALFWKAGGLNHKGCVLALTGKVSETVQVIPAAIIAQQSTGATNWMPWWLSHLARAYAELLQVDDAWRCIDEALTAIEATKEKWCEAEVDRIAGEIALMSPEPHPAKAEAYFERALAVARQQQAKSWELRAAMSMARLWRDQGKRIEARELLAPVYGWFTEGFDTLDLKQAKALLDELAS
jgi:predicted ATPase